MPSASHRDQAPSLQRSSSSSISAFPIPNSTFHNPPSPILNHPQPLIEPLSNRELKILVLLGQRLRNKEIASKLFVSPGTIKKHLSSIYRKLNVNGSLQAVEKAQALDILPQR